MGFKAPIGLYPYCFGTDFTKPPCPYRGSQDRMADNYRTASKKSAANYRSRTGAADTYRTRKGECQ